jgi:hypothetical protein
VLDLDTSDDGEEQFDLDAALEDFLVAARAEGLTRLITAEQNYTDFLIAQLNIQMAATKALQDAVSDATGVTTH